MEEKGYRRLKVWQKAHELVLTVYEVTKNFPKEETFGIISQIRRASFSAPANIAEGYTRAHTKEYLQSLNVAQASLAEVEYYLQLSLDLKYIKEERFKELMNMRDEVAKILNGLIKSIRRKL